MKLTDLLDQIDRLDQQATKGPWESHFGGNPGDKWLSVEPKTGARTICTITDDHQQNAEFIALSRTAMPALAAAVKGVLDVLDAHPEPRKEADPTGYATTRLELLEHRVREAIQEAIGDTDALEADDAQ